MEGFIRQAGGTRPAPSRTLTTLAVLMLVLMALGFLMAGKAQAQEIEPGDDFVDGEVVVKLNKASGTTLDGVYSAYPEVDRAGTETFLASSGIYLLRLQAGSDTEEVERKMSGDTARFIYAELNYTTDAPEDSRHMSMRGENTPEPSSDSARYQNQYAVGALNLPEAHRANKGTGSTVAVLDTGVQLDHPELAGSLVPGYDFIGDDGDPTDAPNSVDDDGDNSVDEAVGHGTHVAGIVHLTAPDAKIMPMRVLDSDGRGNVFVIAEAVQRAVDPDGNPNTNDGADVINMSLSSSRESFLIRDVSDDLDAIDDDDDDDETGPALRGVPVGGTVVVGSAGNDAAEQRAYPAAETGVLGVASVGQDEKKSDFSNYFGLPEVDISAPGDDIVSLFPTNQYAEWDGTSMAAPFVAGQAALIRSVRPGLPSTAPQGQESVTEFITSTARSIDAKNPNYSGKLGTGHADIYESLKKANTAPTVSAMRPTGSTRDRTPLIAATVTDAETDLAESDLTLSVDGRSVGTFSYNADTDRLTHTSRRLSYGLHSVRITAMDSPGSSVTRTWRFEVVR